MANDHEIELPDLFSIVHRQNDKAIDEVELIMMQHLIAVDCPIHHLFTPGLWIREVFVPAGTLITSKIHKTKHPFRISQGCIFVSVDQGEIKEMQAPYKGVTLPGTRRVLLSVSDTVWSTFHALSVITGDEDETDKELIDQLEDLIFEPYNHKLLDPVSLGQWRKGAGIKPKEVL